MLARALALNPRVLLLDDFTARVDTTTERKILENVRAELSRAHAAVGDAEDRAGRGLRPDRAADGRAKCWRRARTASCSRRVRSTCRSMTPSEAPATTNPYRLSSAAARRGSASVRWRRSGGSRRCMAGERGSVVVGVRRDDRRVGARRCSGRSSSAARSIVYIRNRRLRRRAAIGARSCCSRLSGRAGRHLRADAADGHASGATSCSTCGTRSSPSCRSCRSTSSTRTRPAT